MIGWRKTAVCVRCGVFKRRYFRRCTACGYEPSSDYELARALILSMGFVAGGGIGRPRPELKRIGGEIARGRPYLFDTAEERRALNVVRELQVIAQRRRRRLRVAAIAVILLTLGVLGLLLWRALATP